MKKIVLYVLVIFLMFNMAACTEEFFDEIAADNNTAYESEGDSDNGDGTKSIVFQGITFCIPTYFDDKERGSTETRVHYYPKPKDYYCSLVFESVNWGEDLSEEDSDIFKWSMLGNILRTMKDTNDIHFSDIEFEEVKIVGLSGLTFYTEVEEKEHGSTKFKSSIVFDPNEDRIIYIHILVDENDKSDYDYMGDYQKILDSAYIDEADTDSESENKVDTEIGTETDTVTEKETDTEIAVNENEGQVNLFNVCSTTS